MEGHGAGTLFTSPGGFIGEQTLPVSGEAKGMTPLIGGADLELYGSALWLQVLWEPSE